MPLRLAEGCGGYRFRSCNTEVRSYLESSKRFESKRQPGKLTRE